MTNDAATKQLNRPVTVFSLIVVGALGVMCFHVLPSMVIGMLTDLELSQAQIGKVSSWQGGGIALGSIISLWLVKIVSWRRIAWVGVSALVITDLLSIFLTDYLSFILIRFLAGTAGGICVSFGAFALGNTRKADRNYGLFLSFQVVSAIVANMFLPGLVKAQGIEVIFIFLVVLEVLTLVLLLKNIPNIDVEEQEAGGTNSGKVWTFCILQLTAIFCFFIALSGFWTYIAPIGMGEGLTEQQAGRGISLGLFGGLAGAFVAAHLNIRIGRLIPVIFAVGMQFLALWVLYSGFGFLVFTLAAGLFMFGWYMFFPYQLGMLAALDRDGRPMILANAIGGIGAAIGPYVVSVFLNGDFVPAYVIGVAFLFLALFGTAMIEILSKKEQKSG